MSISTSVDTPLVESAAPAEDEVNGQCIIMQAERVADVLLNLATMAEVSDNFAGDSSWLAAAGSAILQGRTTCGSAAPAASFRMTDALDFAASEHRRRLFKGDLRGRAVLEVALRRDAREVCQGNGDGTTTESHLTAFSSVGMRGVQLDVRRCIASRESRRKSTSAMHNHNANQGRTS